MHHLKKAPILVSSDLRLDWAIREAASTDPGVFPGVHNIPFIDQSIFTSGDQIILKTPWGLKGGVQEGTGIMCSIPMGDSPYISPQRVQVITLPEDNQVIPGDCGS